MMKFLFPLLLLLPFLAIGQNDKPKNETHGIELGLNIGYAPDNASEGKLERGGYIRSSLSLLQSRGKLQYGLVIDGGTNSDDYWYLSPGLELNYKSSEGTKYFYAGAMAGYVCSRDMMPDNASFKLTVANGYVLGLQGGIVCPVGKRLSFCSELAIRITRVWENESYELRQLSAETILYLPITVGLRYRL